jgi:hypothetical protein
MKVMERFIDRSKVRTIFMIDCINGKEIKSHSFYKDENEIILMPGTYLRVIDKWSPADNLYMIRLQEETPPCQLVTPPFISSSSVNALPINKITISDTNKPKHQAASTPSTGKSSLLHKSIEAAPRISSRMGSAYSTSLLTPILNLVSYALENFSGWAEPTQAHP